MLEKEFEYFLAHQSELVKKFQGRIVVIKDEKVLGDYSTEIEAINETQKTHELGTFLVQKCEPGDSAYSMTFHSRVVFA